MFNTYALNYETIKWIPKTRDTKKLGMNMNVVLNPGLKQDIVISIEESLS